MVRRLRSSRHSPTQKAKSRLVLPEFGDRFTGVLAVDEMQLITGQSDEGVHGLSVALGPMEEVSLDLALLVAVLGGRFEAELSVPRQSCVAAAVMVRNVLALLGVDSAVQSVVVDVKTQDGIASYGWQDGLGPGYDPEDGMFCGHAIVVVPPLGRFCDPTISQYRGGTRPFIAPLPHGGNRLSDTSMVVHRDSEKTVWYMVNRRWNDRWVDHQHRPLVGSEAAKRSWWMARHIASGVVDFLYQSRGPELAEIQFPPIATAAATLKAANGDLQLERITDERTGPRWQHARTQERLTLEDLTGLDLMPLPYYHTT